MTPSCLTASRHKRRGAATVISAQPRRRQQERAWFVLHLRILPVLIPRLDDHVRVHRLNKEQARGLVLNAIQFFVPALCPHLSLTA